MRNFDNRYVELPEADVASRIADHKRRFGTELVILAHHYQPEETFRFADFTGDSLKLSQAAAERRSAKYIVFCGVHFMAEVARMLCGREQRVILPDPTAGCSMADMATVEQVQACWTRLERLASGKKIVPITYINSSASIKAFCGRHDGAICTSGNAGKIVPWAMQHGDLVLFLPDQHLGRNTGYALGLRLDQMVVDDPERERLDSLVRMILWPGYCNVHMVFTVEDVQRSRREYPDARIIVHPECRFEVVREADESGSTEYMLKRVRESAEGSVWVIGTEKAMVDRLKDELAGRNSIFHLSRGETACPTMKLCTARRLLWVLDNLAEGEVVNEIFVDDEVARESQVALERMLQIR